MSKTVRVRGEGVSAFSVGGEEYRAGRGGAIEIPVEALPDAIALGLSVVAREAKRTEEDEPKGEEQ